MKPQEKNKKKKWSAPAWLNKIRLDRRTKIVSLFVVAIAGILFFLYQYNMRYVRSLEYEGTTVTDREVFAQLQQGTAEAGDAVWLSHFGANEPLYRRGSHYYIGEDHVRIQDGAPLFVNDGTYVNIIGQGGALIDAQWVRQPAMSGMYLSNGQSFNYDGTMIDEEPVFFFHMDNGLYVNTKGLVLKGLLQTVEVPVNSFAHIDADGVRYFARQDGELFLYGSFTQVYGAEVEIGGQIMSYPEFLRRLGIYDDEEFPERQTETEPVETPSAPETDQDEGDEESSSDEELSLEDLLEPEQPGGGSSMDEQGEKPDSAESSAKDSDDGQTDGAGKKDSAQDGKKPSRGKDQGNKNRPGQSGGKDHGGSHDSTAAGNESSSGAGNESSSGAGNESSGVAGNESSSGAGNESSSGTGNESSSGAGNESSSGAGNESSSGAGNESSSGAGNESSSGAGNESSSGAGDESSSGAGNESSSGAGDESSSGAGNESSSGAGDESSGATGDESSGAGDESSGGTEDESSSAEEPSSPSVSGGNASVSGGNVPGDGGDGGDGGGGDRPPYEIEWKKPVVTLSDLEMDVYSGKGTLEIDDSYGAFAKVTLSMSWEDNLTITNPGAGTAVRYRKVLKGPGTFQIDNLPPGKKIYVAAHLQYFDKDGKKVRETEPFKEMVVETKPFSMVDHLCLSFSDNINHSSSGQYYERQGEVYDLKISAANEYLLGKVYRAEIKMYPKGHRDEPVTFRMSSSALKRYMYTERDYTTSLTQGLLDPNTEYRYEIALWDAFGNCFTQENKVCWGEAVSQTGADCYTALGYDVQGTAYRPGTGDAWEPDKVLGSQRFWGYTHTSKTVPKAAIEQRSINEPQETLSRAELRLSLTDPHRALTTGAATGNGIAGTPPEDRRGNYKVYFAVYSEKSGMGAGNELPVTVEKDGGLIRVKEDGKGSRFQYVDSAVLPEKGGMVYSIEGLTAGETYMIRVFGTYDLNDNHGMRADEELGALRFGTIPLSSYGRIYYTLNNRHIHTTPYTGIPTYDHDKYESATAQELSLTLNTKRTNAVLAEEYFDRLYLELKKRETNESLIRIMFSKEAREGLTGLRNREVTVKAEELDADGAYTYTLSQEAQDYTYESAGGESGQPLVPVISIKIPVTGLPDAICEKDYGSPDTVTEYRFNLWDAFLAVTDDKEGGGRTFSQARSELLLTFGEDSLHSYTDYVLYTESYASQGSEDSHNVTASSSAYYQRRFTTLKEMPFVTVGGVLQVGRYLYLVDIDFHDTDQSIYPRNQECITLRNVNKDRNNTTATKYAFLDYSIQGSGGRIAEASFDSLQMESTYDLEIAPMDIRRTGRTTSFRYQYEVLYTNEYVAGRGVVGNLFMAGITHPVKGLTEQTADGEKYHTSAEYNRYEIGNFQYGTMSVNEEGKLEVVNRDSNRYVMDAMAVKPGQIYYLNRLNSNNDSTVSVAFLDAEYNVKEVPKTVPSHGYLKIPDGVSYMQLSMSGELIAYQSQVILVYDENDSALTNQLQMVSPRKSSGGKTITFTADDLEKGDVLAVVNGEWVNGGNGAISVSWTVDGVQTNQTVWSGACYEIPKDAKNLSVTVNSDLKGCNGETVAPDVRVIDSTKVDIFSKYYYDVLIADYRTYVRDYNNSLKDPNSGGVRVTVRAYDKDGNETAQPDDAGLDGVVNNGLYEENKSFQTETGLTYRLSLEVCWRGTYYPLDQQEFTAEESEYSIGTGNQMMKLMAWPFGKFRVIADLGEIDPFTVLKLRRVIGNGVNPGETYPGAFGGILDGQGHSMTVNIPTSGYSGFMNVGDNGIIENVDFTFNLGTGDTYMRYVYPLGDNRGVIRNAIFNVCVVGGNFRHMESGGVCRTNIGTIEKFALYYRYSNATAGTYMGYYSGGMAEFNSGHIRNGVVYGERPFDVSTGVWAGSTDVELVNVGGLVGQNYSTGVVEQVLAVLNMRVEQNRNVKDQSAAFGSYGLLVGGNSGIVRNCFTSGDMYYRYWYRSSNNEVQPRVTGANTNINWPGCNSASASSVRNNYYFSVGEYKVNNENIKHLIGRAALKSPQFYGNTVNRDGAFVVESQLDGEFYPIVDMPACMDGRQRNIPLDATMPGSIPSYVSSSLVKDNNEDMAYLEDDILSAEQVEKITQMVGDTDLLGVFLETRDDGSAMVKNQFALADVVIANRNTYGIEDIQVNGLTTMILSKEDSGGFSVMRVLTTPYVKSGSGDWVLTSEQEAFTSSHTVKSFKYGYTADSMTTLNVSQEFMNIDFYYPLSYQTWNENTPRGERVNYRLREDIAFMKDGGKFGSYTAMRTALTFFGVDASPDIQGIFDGGGHSLEFGDLADLPEAAAIQYFFRAIGAGGELKDLYVKNLTLYNPDREPYLGFIREAKSKSVLSGIHIRDITMKGAYTRAGSLVAAVTENTIVDCTVVGAEITSSKDALGLYAGGMAGQRSGSQSVMKNSYVRGLELDTTAGNSVNGSGGLIGCDSRNNWYVYPIITSCYAEGNIHTGFANAGGFLGRGQTQISNAFSAVDIVGTNHVGSLIGYAASWGGASSNYYAGTVSSGELYASSERLVRRLTGYWQISPSASNVKRSYVYEGQILNSAVSKELMDATALEDKDEMKQQQFWIDTVSLGRYFHFTGTDTIRGVENADDDGYVYPILYASDGATLLPDQTEIYYYRKQPDFRVIEALADDQGITPEDPYGQYDLTFMLEIEGKLNDVSVLKDKMTADGLNFENAEYTKVENPEGASEGRTYVQIKGVEATRRLDSYRLTYEYGDEGKTVSTKLAFKDSKGNDIYLYWQIDMPAKWEQKVVTDGHGYQYENFMVCNDLDLNTTNTITPLKLNRLRGRVKEGWSEESYRNRSQEWINENQKEFYSISRVNKPNATSSWITEISNYMGYLDIRNCSAASSAPIGNFGIIGTINGDVEYVDFYNNTITLADNGTDTSYNNFGCIGNVQGDIYRSRICNMRVRFAGSGGRYGYIGGLAGYVRGLREIYAFGTNFDFSQSNAANSYRVYTGTSNANITNSYFGGVAGCVFLNAQAVYGEKMEVYGINSTGTLVGGARSIRRPAETSLDTEVHSCRVAGRDNVGGAMGSGIDGGSVYNILVIGSTVTASGNYAGGVAGNVHTVSNAEIYGSTVEAGRGYAGGITGASTYSGISYSKAAGIRVRSDGNYVGGITGGAYCGIRACAVYNAEISGNSYVGGLIGRNLNEKLYTQTAYIRYNTVANAAIKGASSDTGGVVGHTVGSQIYANEVNDDVTVEGDQNCGGLAGYSSGGLIYHNIIGANVKGTTSVGGLIGRILGYGVPPAAGGDMQNKPAKVYGNIVACEEISANGRYVGGLIGLYEAGTEPVDGEGVPIENSGFVPYMSSNDFYGNAILVKAFGGTTSSSRFANYYANYAEDNKAYMDGLPNGELPNYDCVNANLKNYGYLRIPTLQSGSEVKKGTILEANIDTLKLDTFYTRSNEDGGLGLGNQEFSYEGLRTGTGFFPYVKDASTAKMMPYQTTGTYPMGEKTNWNVYYSGSGDNWTETSYTGDGIPISITTRANLRSVARGMVYPSGPDTVNIDFSKIDNSLVNFEIEGYLEKTSIDAVKDTAGVCSLRYDYQTDFVLTLYSLDGSQKETYVYRADQLRRTVMTWNGRNYYILSDGLYQGMDDGSVGKLLDGEFVHLFQGKALDSSGEVHELTFSMKPSRIRRPEKKAEEETSSAAGKEEASSSETAEEKETVSATEEAGKEERISSEVDKKEENVSLERDKKDNLPSSKAEEDGGQSGADVRSNEDVRSDEDAGSNADAGANEDARPDENVRSNEDAGSNEDVRSGGGSDESE